MKMYVVFKYTWIFRLGVMQKVKRSDQSLFESVSCSSGLLVPQNDSGHPTMTTQFFFLLQFVSIYNVLSPTAVFCVVLYVILNWT